MTEPTAESSRTGWHIVTMLGAAVGVIALCLTVAAGPLYKAGVVDLFPAFGILRMGAQVGLAAIVVGLVGLYFSLDRQRGLALSAVGLLCAALAIGGPLYFRSQGAGVPPIHDITTDLENPPEFVDIVPLRADAPNTHEYVEVVKRGDREFPVKAAQMAYEGYDDIKTIELDAPPEAAFDRARNAAESLGWPLVAAEPEEGRIEAFDETTWFGFIDDVVIRITPAEDGGSLVDVRSKSRVGLSDVGKNAARIRAFRDAL